MLLEKETIGDIEVRLEFADDFFVRSNYGSYYVIARHMKLNRERRQIFQDHAQALKYYKYFVDFFSNTKAYFGAIVGPKKELIRDMAMERKVNKAPWYYNQGKKFEGVKIPPRQVA